MALFLFTTWRVSSCFENMPTCMHSQVQIHDKHEYVGIRPSHDMSIAFFLIVLAISCAMFPSGSHTWTATLCKAEDKSIPHNVMDLLMLKTQCTFPLFCTCYVSKIIDFYRKLNEPRCSHSCVCCARKTQHSNGKFSTKNFPMDMLLRKVKHERVSRHVACPFPCAFMILWTYKMHTAILCDERMWVFLLLWLVDYRECISKTSYQDLRISLFRSSPEIQKPCWRSG